MFTKFGRCTSLKSVSKIISANKKKKKKLFVTWYFKALTSFPRFTFHREVAINFNKKKVHSRRKQFRHYLPTTLVVGKKNAYSWKKKTKHKSMLERIGSAERSLTETSIFYSRCSVRKGPALDSLESQA